MRKLTDHKVNGLNDALEVTALDEPGAGGANHHYRIKLTTPGTRKPDQLRGAWPYEVDLFFQNGPIASPLDFNGITNEALLTVLIDRMEGFQCGPYHCDENGSALQHLKSAMYWLQVRTKDRMKRGVEGSNAP
jgi:hypothetical protein